MGNDPGRWSYIGRIWIENDMPPYKDSIENKTPGIFILYAISHYFFGINYFFPRSLGALTIILTSVLLFKVGKKIHDKHVGLIGAMIFSLSMFWEVINSNYVGHTETFMVFFSTATFYLLLINHYDAKLYLFLIKGFFLGLAIAFKQIAIVTLLAFILYVVYFFREDLNFTAKLLGYTLFGVIFATLFSLVPLFWSGVSFIEYIEGAWLILLNEGSSYPLSVWRIPKFFELFFGSKMMVFYPILAIGLFQFVASKRTRFINLLLCWFVIAFIGVNASGYYWGHQVTQLLPPISLLASIIINYNINIQKFILYRVLIIIFILSFPYNQFIKNIASIISSENEISKTISNHILGNTTQKKIGDWIRNNSSKEDYIYYYGSKFNPIISYSDRISASKHFNTTFIKGRSIKNSVTRDLVVKKPEFIIKEKNVLEQEFIEKLLREKYLTLKIFPDYCKVYKRKNVN
jgi:hypothetical protein